MLRRSLVNQPSSVTTSDGDGSAADDIYCVFESIIQFSVELRKLDLDVTETAMFAAATLVQQGRLGTNEVGKSQCLKWKLNVLILFESPLILDTWIYQN